MKWIRRLLHRPEPTTLESELADWRIVKAASPSTGQAAVFRVRIKKPRIDNLNPFCFAMKVRWPYDGLMPTPELSKQQETFDVALDELTGDNGTSP